jgi:phosphotransferase system enzyme I (PtsI)
MPLSLHGIGVSRGYAIGNTLILERNQPEVIEYALPEPLIDDEVERFLLALRSAKQELGSIRSRIPTHMPPEITAFIDTHLLMLEDATLAEAPVKIIRSHRCNAEWALKIQRDLVVEVFEAMDDPYLRARKDDVDHVVRRVQRILLADDPDFCEMLSTRLENRIVVADDLTPADTILMQHQGISAFVTEFGGPLSHTAILARSLGIPAVVGAHNARRYLSENELIVVDGTQGVILADLGEQLLEHYRWRKQDAQARRSSLSQLKEQPSITRDAVPVDLYANIELPEDSDQALAVDAAGVGLYRTEFLFMNRADAPDEEEHLASYLHVLKSLGDRPVTIRTADMGADKQLESSLKSGPLDASSVLGLRGIRFCLRNPEVFRPQLRAILRASAFGSVRLMLPMLSNLHELRQALRLIEGIKRELRTRGQKFNENVPIGGMIEVPAAAMCASYFARYLDFLSIGTNDLIQYTLAIDRTNDEVNYLYDPAHPAVLKLIRGTIVAANRIGIPVSLCGEMAGDPRYTQLLLGLGLTQFSMHPASLLEVKRIIRASHAGGLRKLIHQLLRAPDPERLSEYLHRVTLH